MKHTKKILVLALVVVTIFTLSASALAAKTAVSGTRYNTSANGNPVNVRTGPGTGYSLAAIGTMAVGTQVTLKYKDTASDGKTWYQVVNSSNSGGWVRSDFLTSTAPWIKMFGSPNIYYGTRSEYVYAVQTTLISLGYNLGTYWTDNLCDDGTSAAIEDFQGDQGLTVDGIVGQQTEKALYYAFINR